MTNVKVHNFGSFPVHGLKAQPANHLPNPMLPEGQDVLATEPVATELYLAVGEAPWSFEVPVVPWYWDQQNRGSRLMMPTRQEVELPQVLELTITWWEDHPDGNEEHSQKWSSAPDSYLP